MRKLSTFLILIAFAVPVFAQIGINPQVGINFSRLTQQPAGSDYAAGVGWQVGLELHIGDKIYFQPGVFYSSSATIIEDQATSGEVYKENSTINSLDIMAQAGFRIINLEVIKLRGHLGPVGSIVTGVNPPSVDLGIGNVDLLEKEDYANFKLYGRVGLTVQITIITVDFGYDFGFTKVFNQDSDRVKLYSVGSDFIDARNNRFYINLGVNIGK